MSAEHTHGVSPIGNPSAAHAGGPAGHPSHAPGHGHGHGHPALAHHFENLEQQQEADNLGMWLFLSTELMVFGGLFTGYTVYRSTYPDAFAAASGALNVYFAGGNTLVLLTSSLTMALGVYYAQVNRRQALVNCLLLTAALGAAFLVIKAFEYHHDYEEGLIPGRAFKAKDEWLPPKLRHQPSPEELRHDSDVANPTEAPRPRQQVSPEASKGDIGKQMSLFLMFYYVMTGLHAVHLIIGIGIMLVLALQAWRGRYSSEYYSPVEVGGLYWHFVDVVWIFLLPLLYLIGSSAH